MTSAKTIAQYLDELLDIQNIPDYSHALNGLQLDNQREITGIAAAVDFSSQTIAGTIAAGANLLIVHHGMFWSGLQPLRAAVYARIKTLIEHDVAVYAAHLPLDKHPEYGNNTQLARQLGLVPTGQFAKYKTIMIGVRGKTEMPTTQLFERLSAFAEHHCGVARSTQIGSDRVTRTWAICTGGASSETLREAAESDIDTLIVGEGPHHTAVEAEELGITVMYGGHYATETLGVQAVSTDLATRYQLPWTFIEAPTGL